MYSLKVQPLPCTSTNYIQLLEKNFSGLKGNTYYDSLYYYLKNELDHIILTLTRGSPHPKKAIENLRETIYNKFVGLYIKGGVYDETVKRNLIQEMLHVSSEYKTLDFKKKSLSLTLLILLSSNRMN